MRISRRDRCIRWADARPKSPPWVVCKAGTVAEIVAEARACEELAADLLERGHPLDFSARSWARWAECCWVWALMALLEGRPMALPRRTPWPDPDA